MFGCLFSLSLKCCLTVPIYDNRPLNVYRNNCTVTRRAESWSLLQPVAFFSSLFFLSLSDSLQEEEESRPPADWLTLGGVGCEAGGRERGRAVKCYRNSWLKRGNGRYRTSSIDTDRVGARLNCSSSRLDYGHRVVTPVPLLPQCGEATAIYGGNAAFVQRSKGYSHGLRMFLNKGGLPIIKLISCSSEIIAMTSWK